MLVYLCNIFIIIIFRIMLHLKPSTKNDKAFCIMASLNWIFLSGMRHFSIGADTSGYKYMFEMIQYKSWNNLMQDFINIIFKGDSGRDPGYSFFEKGIQLFTTNYQVYLLIIALIFTVPLGIWIYKNSSEPLMSFLLYSSLFYSFFSITGIRQTIATALATLIGYKFIKERKLIPFLFLTFIAMLIHRSVICFLPFYFMANKKITKQYLVCIVGAATFIFIFKDIIFELASKLIGYADYTKYEGAGTWTFTTFLLLMLAIVIWKREEIISNNAQSVNYINALLFSVLLVPSTFINPSAMRIVQYYSIYLLLLLPEIIRSFRDKEKALVYVISASILIVLLIRDNPFYMFFWQW